MYVPFFKVIVCEQSNSMRALFSGYINSYTLRVWNQLNHR